MTEFNEHPEPLRHLRANGAQHGFQQERRNWLERREEEFNFEKTDPDVLVIGKSKLAIRQSTPD